MKKITWIIFVVLTYFWSFFTSIFNTIRLFYFYSLFCSSLFQFSSCNNIHNKLNRFKMEKKNQIMRLATHKRAIQMQTSDARCRLESIDISIIADIQGICSYSLQMFMSCFIVVFLLSKQIAFLPPTKLRQVG